MTEYIKREDLMERVGRWQLNTREAIAEMIMSVPSADVRPVVRGKWIETKFSRFTYYKCSVCNASYECENAEFDLNFCPNCGAKMESENKDDK